ncbi:MAG: hypothetical protein OXE76_04115 [Alphaproteobacteria bacterium]|nr:hypothetical protein [Alphaproteobacteria bacterium]
MDADEIRRVKDELGWSIDAMSHNMCVSRRSVCRWLSGHHGMSAPAERLLREFHSRLTVPPMTPVG